MCSGTRRAGAAARDAARDVQTKSTRQSWRKKLLCRPSQKPSSKQRVDLAKIAACAARVAACDVGVNPRIPTPPAVGMNPTPPAGGYMYSLFNSLAEYEFVLILNMYTPSVGFLARATVSQSVSYFTVPPRAHPSLRRSQSNTSTEYTRSPTRSRGLLKTQLSQVRSNGHST